MKKILSVIVVLCTIISTTLMITISKNRNKVESKQPKVEVFKVKENNSDLESKLESKSERSKNETPMKNIEKEKSKQESKEESNFYKWASYKKVKRNYIYGEIAAEKEAIKINETKVESMNVNIVKAEPIKEKEIAVLNLTRVNKEAKLTEKEKENLLFLSKKLSAVDYWKIKEYIESDNMEILKAIYLMESKLSKKESEGLKEIANRFTIEKIN